MRAADIVPMTGASSTAPTCTTYGGPSCPAGSGHIPDPSKAGTIGVMAPGEMIRSARRQAGLSLPALAERVGVPAEDVMAYEAGAKTPDAEMLDWIIRCATFDRGEELAAVLELAEQFPARHGSELEYPVFGR